MIDTILLDLDGTLLPLTQDAFITAYFAELKKVFTRLDLDAELAVQAVWSGTKSMVLNDGTKRNSERFWEKFSSAMDLTGERLKVVENACDMFYANEFDTVKRILEMNDPDQPQRLMRLLVSKGFDIVLATNPLFPTCAVTTRLRWIGLSPSDFCLVTDYANSAYCKPNTDYYREIFGKLRKKPEQCLMVGNNTREDMIVGTLGADTFLVTDCLENEAGVDISTFRHGSMAELEMYLKTLQSV